MQDVTEAANIGCGYLFSCATRSGTRDSTLTNLPRTAVASTFPSVFLAVAKIICRSVTDVRMQFHALRTCMTDVSMATVGLPRNSTARHTTHQCDALHCNHFDVIRLGSPFALAWVCRSAARCALQRVESIFTAPISHASDRILLLIHTCMRGSRRA